MSQDLYNRQVKKTMKRCAKCILPENYPGITFNEEGICNHCFTYKKKKYFGDKALKEKIGSYLERKKDRNKDYDCVLGLSGGRDSSCLLYYLVKILNLRVLAYSADNGFIPEQTKLNMKNMTDVLKVKLVIEEHDYLRRCLRHHILSWIHSPSPVMVGMLCAGCKLGIDLGLFNFAKSSNIPVVIRGGTPFEGQGYKVNMMKLNPNSRNNTSFIIGYLSEILRNPRWILKPACSIIQLKEYYYHFCKRTIQRDKDLLAISPYYYYVRWQENDVISTIKNELRWQENPDAGSTWRGDCFIALLKLYLYKKILGFNDKDDGLSCLIRDNQISRKEGLKRLNKEGEISEKVIREIFDKLGLKYSDLSIALKKIRDA